METKVHKLGIKKQRLNEHERMLKEPLLIQDIQSDVLGILNYVVANKARKEKGMLKYTRTILYISVKKNLAILSLRLLMGYLKQTKES